MNYSELIESYKNDLRRYSLDQLRYVSEQGVWSLGQLSIKIKLPDGPENNPSNSESKDGLMRGLDLVLIRMSEWIEKVGTINPYFKVRHDGFGWLNLREWFDLFSMHFHHHLRQKSELEQKACGFEFS